MLSCPFVRLEKRKFHKNYLASWLSRNMSWCMIWDVGGRLFRLGVTAWVGVPDGEFIITFVMFSVQEFGMLQSDIVKFCYSLVNSPLLLEMMFIYRQVSCCAQMLEDKSANAVVIRLHHCNKHHTLRIPLWNVVLSFLFTNISMK